MRLSPLEVAALLKVIRRHLPAGIAAQIFLFGSRARDELKGGDIDLAVIVEDPNVVLSLTRKDYQITAELKAQPVIGDQKIDLKIITPAEAQNAFFKEALARAILLK